MINTTSSNNTARSITTVLRHKGNNVTIPEGCVMTSVGDFIPWDNPDNLVSQETEQAVDTAVALAFLFVISCPSNVLNVLMSPTPDNLVSQETEQAVDTAVALAFLPVLFVISCPSNVLNVLVFWRQGLQDRINLCLFCLSVVDLVYMLHAFLMYVDRMHYSLVGSDPSQVGPVLRFIVVNRLMGFRGLTWVSGLLSTLIACERCFLVVSPLKTKTLLDTRTTGLLIAVSTTIVLGGFFVVGTRWGVACVYDAFTNITATTIYASDFYINHRFFLDVLDGIVYGLILPGLYVIVVTATTIVTLLKLRKMAAWREQTSSAPAVSAREVALTRMLIGISVLYVVCEIPTLVTGLCIWLVPDFSLQGRYYNAFNMLISIFELFSYINSSFNFFIYCFLGSRYKETLRDIFFCVPAFRKGKQHQKSSTAKEISTTFTVTRE